MVGASRTTPVDPMRARCRPGWVDRGIIGRVHGCEPVRGPLPDVPVHIGKAPGVGRILPHLLGLICASLHVELSSWHGKSSYHRPRNTPWRCRPGRHIPTGIRWVRHNAQSSGIRPALRCLLNESDCVRKSHEHPSKYTVFHGASRVAVPVARRGTNYMPSTGSLGNSRHHRLVLGLGHLVLAEVKATG